MKTICTTAFVLALVGLFAACVAGTPDSIISLASVVLLTGLMTRYILNDR